MKVVADANIVFACLLKDGLTRRLWFNPVMQVCAPAFMLSELAKYRAELAERYGGTAEEFDRLVERVFAQVQLVSDEELKPFLPAAASLSTDRKDWLYLACALKEDAVLWSNDLEFRKQTRVKVKTTQELAAEVGLL